MSEPYTTLRDGALKLPEDKRAALAYELLDSLEADPPDINSMTEEEFKAELDRRAEELRQHPDRAVPWEQVKDLR